MNWSWPQYLVAVFMVFGFVVVSVARIRDDKVTSDRAALGIFLYAAYYAAYAYVLHAGRFW